MQINDLLFTENLPRIDLHGYTRNEIKLYIDDFISNSIKLKYEFVVIIHGIGDRILSNETQKILKRHPRVEDYKLTFNNPGATLVKIRLK